MRWVKNHIRLSSRYNGFLTFYLYPVIGVLGAGSLMLFVIGEPVAWINNALTAWLNGLSGANALLLGAILGFMCSFDLGGAVNKASYAFCLGAMANGVYALCDFCLRQNGIGLYRDGINDAGSEPVQTVRN